MKRHLCATALFALALLPDWASACWPRWGGPISRPVYHAPAYRMPVYRRPIYYSTAPVFVEPCVPVPPPMIVPLRAQPMQPKGRVRIEPAPQNEPVRPAAAVEVPKPPASPPRVEVPQPPAARPDPAPAASEPSRGPLIEIPKPREPKAPTVEVPKPPIAEPKLPPIELPKVDGPKLPPLELPTGPAAEPKLPPIELTKDTEPKVPPLDLPGAAVPSAAPAPDSLIPAPKGPDSLPPLTLPPDSPILPEKPVEAKSSPLTGAGRELKVSVFPASGSAAGSGLRKVGFYNHTARDLALTIEGKAVTLPAQSYLHAQLPSSFTWKCGDKSATKETVPAGAVGVDVLIRE